MIREVANWFHDREGELFERDEAAKRVADDLNIDESGARDFIRDLVGDLVDPVEQVVVEGEKYVGVIEYEEHRFWYEYVHYHDMLGELRRGVCGQCVQEEERDTEVFHATQGMGSIPEDASTGEIEEKLREHLEERHGMSPREVETGANLLSGTTVGGNTVIHSGNDGSGSGVNADLLDGMQETSFIVAGSLYGFSGAKFGAGEAVESLSNPSMSSVYGVGVMSSPFAEQRWYLDRATNNLVRIDGSGSVIESMSYPRNDPCGMELDKLENFWVSDGEDKSIYRLRKGLSRDCIFSSPESNPTGIAIDKEGSIWCADETSNSESFYRLTGEPVRKAGWQYSSSAAQPRGIAKDPETKCIWHADTEGNLTNGSIYRLYGSGSDLSIDQAFASPSGDPTALDFAPDGCIWHVDTNGSIYKLSVSGSSLVTESQWSAPTSDPRGVSVPNSDCIWYSAQIGGGSIYRMNVSSGSFTIESQWSYPGAASDSNPLVHVDGNGCIWTGDNRDNSLFKTHVSGNSLVVDAQLPIAGSNFTGLDIVFSDAFIWQSDQTGGSLYLDRFTREIESQFDTPDTTPQGLGVDSDGCIWHVDSASDSVYKMDRNASVIPGAGFNTGLITPTGIEVDHDGSIWCTESDEPPSIYRFDRSGSVVKQFAAPSNRISPSSDIEGLAIDGSGCIWVADEAGTTGKPFIFRLNRDGVVESHFSPTGSVPLGLEFDSEGCLWITDWNTQFISKKKPGEIAVEHWDGFSTPGNSPEGIALSPTTYSIWHLDSDSQEVFELNWSGNEELGGFSDSELSSGKGLGMGSDRCIWYMLDDGSGTLKKSDQIGSVISSFTTPSSGPRGLSFERNSDMIWHADIDANSIYKITGKDSSIITLR